MNIRVSLASIGLLLIGAVAQARQAPAAVPPLHRPRDRQYDVLNYRLTIEADLRGKTVAGETEITLVPIGPLFDVVRLDAAAGMTISRVRVDGTGRVYEHRGDTLEIPLGRPYAVTETLTVSATHSVTAPAKGLYFSGPDDADP
ncbi:MAG TPA: hypothetical protein VI932_12570, partial [Bacteroidota bacterium]|nr:hypothetical protein [Bacteroidota bacterium]